MLADWLDLRLDHIDCFTRGLELEQWSQELRNGHWMIKHVSEPPPVASDQSKAQQVITKAFAYVEYINQNIAYSIQYDAGVWRMQTTNSYRC